MRVSPHTAQALQRPGAGPSSLVSTGVYHDGVSPLGLPSQYAPAAAIPPSRPTANRRTTRKGPRVRRLLSQPSVAFPRQDGSPSSLASEHLLDVGSLAGRARASRIRLITNRRSLLPASCPAPPSASLAVGLPRTQGGRAGSTLASEEGREDRAVLGPERSRPTAARQLTVGKESSGRAAGQAKVRGFHVPLQKSTRW